VRLFDAVLRRIDGFQRRHRWLSFPLAVFKKFGDDQGGNLAALVAYYGFFSLFPLLLVLVSVLAILLRDNEGLREKVLDTALGQFPVIGDQLQVGALEGSSLALAVGIGAALWAGLGVTQAFQKAMNDVWDVPMKSRPGFLPKRVRGLLVLLLLGAFAIAATVVSALGSARGILGLLRVAGILGSFLLNVGLFLLAFRILTDKDVSWGDIFPGAAVAGLLWTVLQSVGSFLVTRQISNAENTYGTFALVIGLLFWIYLGAQLTILSAEINVVRKRKLWPRTILSKPLGEADERVLRDAAKVEERIPEEAVDVSFDREALKGSEPEDRSGEARG
jgi:YihY family inner membrane protein